MLAAAVTLRAIYLLTALFYDLPANCTTPHGIYMHVPSQTGRVSEEE